MPYRHIRAYANNQLYPQGKPDACVVGEKDPAHPSFVNTTEGKQVAGLNKLRRNNPALIRRELALNKCGTSNSPTPGPLQ